MNETQKLEAIEDIERLTLDRMNVKTINWQKRYEKLKDSLTGTCEVCVSNISIKNCNKCNEKNHMYQYDTERFEGGKQ